MTQIDKQTVLQLAQLCKIHCNDSEIEELIISLQKMLIYIEQLNEIDTDGVPSFQCKQNTSIDSLREDVISEPLNRELLLKNAPDTYDDLIKVPIFLKTP